MTSIKEALEQAGAMLLRLSRHYTIPESYRIRFTGKWSHMGDVSLGEILDNVNAALAALASLESGDARDIDHAAGLAPDETSQQYKAAVERVNHATDREIESAIRADERERCAKVVDVQLQWDDREEIAAAIRAGRGER